MNNRFIILLLLLNGAVLFSQNLVPNPSFETLRDLPVKPNPKNTFEYEPESGYIPYMENLMSWFAATKTTPDLRINSPANYFECQRKFKNCDRAKSGINCVGIITYMQNDRTKTYREYLQIRLKENIRPHDTVYVECWVAKERQAKIVSNNIGFHFSMKNVFKSTKEVLDYSPQVNYDSIINEEKKKWIKIEGKFIPDKPYKYLLIGNFFDNKKTEAKTFKNFNGSPWTPPYAYYLIDDVRVWQDEPPEKELVFGDEIVSKNQVIELKNIEFDFDKATLRDTSITELNKLFTFLEKHPKTNIMIQGHTDSWGSDHYNQRLSEDRAQAVFNFLVEKGINSKRLQYKGFGEGIPAEENTSDNGRSRNRRVEFLIL